MTSVRVPANVDLEDRIVFDLTARQVGLLAPVAVALLTAWHTLNQVAPIPILLGGIALIAATAVALVLGKRDGTSLDRLVWAAIRHPRTRLAPGHPAPAAVRSRSGGNAVAGLTGPVRAVTGGGVDLGGAGFAVGLDAAGVNFALRSGSEQAMLIAGFARLLHAITGSLHIVVSTHPATMDTHVAHARGRARVLPHGRLKQAAREHAEWLDDLAGQAVMVRREVTVVVTAASLESADRAAAGVADACGGFGVACRRLSGGELAGRIRAYVDPYTPTPREVS